jgi:5-dehydro-2-deoxygluconokinase
LIDEAPGQARGLEAGVMGRVGADIYPNEINTPLSRVRTFTRFAGGFAANVSTGLARLGVRAAIISGVGDDGHGEFVRAFLQEESVNVRWLRTDPIHRTPLAFCEAFPPDRFPFTFYREPTAPDWEITSDQLDLEEIRSLPLLYASGTGLARSPSRETTLRLLEDHAGTSLFDLDWRPTLWRDPSEYPPLAQQAVLLADIVVGNGEELRTATGFDAPERAARNLLDLGPRLVVVKQGAEGATAFAVDGRWQVGGVGSEVVNGLGAGDAFDAALGWGLLRGVPVGRALQDANASGAFVASQLGCSEAMPRPHQLDAFVRTLGRTQVGTVR